ncbi:hypothetical protein KV679_02625 [Bacillus sp. JRC01]|nr:hypothetical protein [Bacillus sp. JRC01]
MGVYKSICYKVEDLFVKTLTKKQDESVVREKVVNYRAKTKSNNPVKK